MGGMIRTLDAHLTELTGVIESHGISAPYIHVDVATCDRHNLDYNVVVDYRNTLAAICDEINFAHSQM